MLPLIATTRPSPSSVTVGYQRGELIFGPAVHLLPTGSKIDVASRPIVPVKPWPPTMTTRPSASVAVPEQKMSRPNGLVTAVSAPVSGSKTLAGLGAIHPSISRSLPVCSSMLCAATMPQSMSGDHCPMSLGPVDGGGGGGGGGGGVVVAADDAYTDAGPSDHALPED